MGKDCEQNSANYFKTHPNLALRDAEWQSGDGVTRRAAWRRCGLYSSQIHAVWVLTVQWGPDELRLRMNGAELVDARCALRGRKPVRWRRCTRYLQ